MTNINSINYLAMNINGNKQLGSSNKATTGKLDLTDGLSEEELKLIDKNKDGSISEEEFKQTFGGKEDTYKTYWDALTSFYNSKCKKTENGSKETSKVDGATVSSNYDKNGKLISYTKTTINAEGVKTVLTYTVENGVAKHTKTTTINTDGTQEIFNNETKVTTNKSIDGTAVSTDKSGNLKTLTTADGNTKINFAYDKNGNITKATVTINGKKVTGSAVTKSKDGKTITIKDKDGNIVAKYHTNEDGETFITAYKNGSKSKCFKLDDNNEPVYVNTYGTSGKNKGKVTQREYCDTGVTRKYTRDDNGKLVKSVDYRQDGSKRSVQTYNSSGDWATRTLYDENGNVSAYQEYSYKKNDDGVITDRTIKKYSDESKNELIATYKDKLDKDGNKTKREVIRPNEPKETIEYKYKNGELVKTTSNKGNVFKETDYKDGKKTVETKTTIVDGKSTTQTTEFDYYGDTAVVQSKKVIKDDGSIVLYEYSTDGELTSKTVLQEPTVQEPSIPENVNYTEQIEALEQQYAQATTNSEKEKISLQIMHLQARKDAEIAEQEGKQDIAAINYEIASLYLEIGNTSNENNQRDNLFEKIKHLDCRKNAIIAEENGDIKEANYQNQLAKLYAELSETKDNGQRRQLFAAISKLECEKKAEIFASQGLDMEASFNKELSELYAELSQTTDYETQMTITNMILSLEAEMAAYFHSQNGEQEIANFYQELAQLYENLTNVTSEDERFSLNCKISEISCLNSAALEELNNNIQKAHIYIELAQLYVKLANAKTNEERGLIDKEIEELRNSL